jgi:hypothetical protein
MNWSRPQYHQSWKLDGQERSSVDPGSSKRRPPARPQRLSCLEATCWRCGGTMRRGTTVRRNRRSGLVQHADRCPATPFVSPDVAMARADISSALAAFKSKTRRLPLAD